MIPVWRHQPFFTNSTEPVDADITHRHAIIQTLFDDLIDGPLAHLPSGSIWANSAWTVHAAIAHNLPCGRHPGGRGAGGGTSRSPIHPPTSRPKHNPEPQ